MHDMDRMRITGCSMSIIKATSSFLNNAEMLKLAATFRNLCYF